MIGDDRIEYKFVRIEIESDCCKIVRQCKEDHSLGIDDYVVDLLDDVTIIAQITMPSTPGDYQAKFSLSLQGE